MLIDKPLDSRCATAAATAPSCIRMEIMNVYIFMYSRMRIAEEPLERKIIQKDNVVAVVEWAIIIIILRVHAREMYSYAALCSMFH